VVVAGDPGIRQCEGGAGAGDVVLVEAVRRSRGLASGTGRWVLVGLDPDTGKQRWVQTRAFDDLAVVEDESRAVLLAVDDQTARLAVLDVRTGSVLWDKPVAPGHFLELVAVVNGEVVVEAPGDHLEVFRLTDGARLRHVTASGIVGKDDAAWFDVLSDDQRMETPLLLASLDNHFGPNLLIGVNTTGRIRWRRTDAEGFERAWTVGDVAVVSSRDEVAALELGSGRMLWQLPGVETKLAGVARDGSAVFLVRGQTDRYKLIAIDPRDESIVRWETADMFGGSVEAVTGDGTAAVVGCPPSGLYFCKPQMLTTVATG
jgi:outer membrane protein assembly factor BamB